MVFHGLSMFFHKKKDEQKREKELSNFSSETNDSSKSVGCLVLSPTISTTSFWMEQPVI